MPSFVSKGFIKKPHAIFLLLILALQFLNFKLLFFSLTISNIILFKYFTNIHQIHGEYNSEQS